MTLTINVFVALLIALGLSVGLFLVGGRHQDNAAKALGSAEVCLATVRDPAAREEVRARVAPWEKALAPIFRALSNRGSAVQEALVRATAIRLALALRFVPFAIFLLALGVLTGMLRRDRARDLVLYSSATFSYFGKFLALVGIAFGVFVAISPFAPAVWSIYPALGLAALGAATYVGHLPPRL